MPYFTCTSETVPAGVGFSAWSPVHLAWLILFVVSAVILSLAYRRFTPEGKTLFRRIMAVLLLADELFKQIMLISFGNWIPAYLPLHLCSINIFLACFHAFRPGQRIGNFLYTVCLPGALAALLFPSWTSLPLGNFMHIHSFTVHILLALYPLVLVAGGDVRIHYKYLPWCLCVLVTLAAVMYVLNPVVDANFFFMRSAGKGNPLDWFQKNWGNHLYGFPVLVTGIIAVMHLPVILWRKFHKK